MAVIMVKNDALRFQSLKEATFEYRPCPSGQGALQSFLSKYDLLFCQKVVPMGQNNLRI